MQLHTKLMDQVEGHKNRVFALKFDPQNPDILYSGGWDTQVCMFDLRTRKRIGGTAGHYVCGDSIDVKDGNLVVGAYKADVYLSIYNLNI
jgi:WD40 repeat protein